MDQAHYHKTIQSLCTEVGLPDWEAVIHTQHLICNDTVVGLIYQPHCHPEKISVYVDLDPVFAERDPDLPRRLLMANLERPQDMAGWFGLHRDTQNAVYHFPLEIPHEPRGAALAEFLTQQIHGALTVFEGIQHA